MISRQDKIRMMWETQQRRKASSYPSVVVPNINTVPQFAPTLNLAAGTNSAQKKKGCGCGIKF